MINKNILECYISEVLKEEVVIYDILETYDDENSIGFTISKSKFNKESKEGYLYQIKNIITGKIYIGRSINPVARVIDHIRSSSSKELVKDFIKYGLINFTVKCWYDEEYKLNEYKLINSYDRSRLYNKIYK